MKHFSFSRFFFAVLSVGSILVVGNAKADFITSANVVGSDTGFGEIQYNPGGNVSEFVLYGRASSGDPYITSAGASHIGQSIQGDGTTVDNNNYTATYYSWTGGSPTASGTWTTESCQPTTAFNGWGVSGYTSASINITSPSSAYEAAFFVHNYYTQSDLQVLRNGNLITTYANVMSSSYLPGGGEARNTDYFYDFNLSGLTAGDVMTFKFTNLQNLGSDWANIGFLSASVNYDAPQSITDNFIPLTEAGGGGPSAIPEPGIPALLLIGALGYGGRIVFNRLKRKTT
jgi:hypothetical protein